MFFLLDPTIFPTCYQKCWRACVIWKHLNSLPLIYICPNDKGKIVWKKNKFSKFCTFPHKWQKKRSNLQACFIFLFQKLTLFQILSNNNFQEKANAFEGAGMSHKELNNLDSADARCTQHYCWCIQHLRRKDWNIPDP